MKAKKEVVILGFFLIAVLFLFLAVKSPPRIVGFAVFEGSCGSAINEEGFWELNATLNCSSLGIAINSSNVTLECNSYSITGSDENSIGISISENLMNITMQNCNITGFETAISSSNSNPGIQDSYAEGTVCVSGNWTDSGGNTGCLDIVGPTISLINQTIYQNQSLSYQLNASDLSGISNFSADNQNFSVNSTGYLINITSLEILNYTINISATDTNNYTSSDMFTIHVIPIPSNQENNNNENNNENDNNNENSNSGESDSESSSSENSEQISAPVSQTLCGDAWNCTQWSKCKDGEQYRACKKVKSQCPDKMPSTTQSCEALKLLECEPNWECTWNECVDGIRTPIECNDLNECGLSPPESETCESRTFRSLLTGRVTDLLSKVGINLNIESIKNNLILFIAIVLGFLLFLIIIIHRKFSLRKKKTQADESDEKKKLWDWEEKNP